MIEIAWAREFAAKWVATWNVGDLQRLLQWCADEVEIVSPIIVVQFGIVSGKLTGKEAIGTFWAEYMRQGPALRLELLEVAAGVSSVAVYYRSATRTRRGPASDRSGPRSRFVIERVEFNSGRQVIRIETLYRPE